MIGGSTSNNLWSISLVGRWPFAFLCCAGPHFDASSATFFSCLKMSGKASGSRFCRIDQLESWPGRVRFSHFFRKMQCLGIRWARSLLGARAHAGGCASEEVQVRNQCLGRSLHERNILMDLMALQLSPKVLRLRYLPMIFRILPISDSYPESDIPEVLKSSWQTASFRPCFIHLGPLGPGWQFLPRHGGDTAASSWDQQRRPRAGGAAGAI